jgi:hypothetical protein
MEPIGTLLVGKLVDATLGDAIGRAAAAVFGSTQQRAIERAVRQACQEAGAAHPALASISADIDVVADDRVVAELIARSVSGDVGPLAAADMRWSEIYETPPPTELGALMTDVAAALRRRLRGDPDLQPIYVATGIGQLLDASSKQGPQLDRIVELLQAKVNSVEAIKVEGERIGADLGYATQVLGEVGVAVARGPLGALDLGVALSGTGASVHIQPRPGHQVEVHVTVRFPQTPEGKARMEAWQKAMRDGAPFELTDTEIQLVVDGIPVQLPGPLKVEAGRAVRRARAVLEFRSAGLQPERFPLVLEMARVGDGVEAETPADSQSLLGVKYRHRLSGESSMSFRNGRDVSSVKEQLKLARVARHLRRGGETSLWFEDFDATTTAQRPSSAKHDRADDEYRILELFEEIQRRVGVEVTAVDELTPEDVALLETAKRLLDRGQATLPGRGGTITLTSAGDIQAQIKANRSRRRRVRVVEGQWILPLSRHPLPMGAVEMRMTVFWPPVGVTRSPDGDFVTDIGLDPKHPVRLLRPPATSEGLEAQPAGS